MEGKKVLNKLQHMGQEDYVVEYEMVELSGNIKGIQHQSGPFDVFFSFWFWLIVAAVGDLIWFLFVKFAFKKRPL